MSGSSSGEMERTVGFLVRPEGLEPPAYWFEASRSIRLSYGRACGSLLSQRNT
jgi:hypothetical protein